MLDSQLDDLWLVIKSIQHVDGMHLQFHMLLRIYLAYRPEAQGENR